jgi:hypothetical protein
MLVRFSWGSALCKGGAANQVKGMYLPIAQEHFIVREAC